MYVCVCVSSGVITKYTHIPPIQCCGTLFFMQKVRRFLWMQNVRLFFFFPINSKTIEGHWNCNIIQKIQELISSVWKGIRWELRNRPIKLWIGHPGPVHLPVSSIVENSENAKRNKGYVIEPNEREIHFLPRRFCN